MTSDLKKEGLPLGLRGRGGDGEAESHWRETACAWESSSQEVGGPAFRLQGQNWAGPLGHLPRQPSSLPLSTCPFRSLPAVWPQPPSLLQEHHFVTWLGSS